VFHVRRTETLWFAIGFHAMSDYADMVLFAQPNTENNGQSLTGHLLNVSYHGAEWLTGGPRGTEASVLEFLILVLMFFVLRGPIRGSKPSPWHQIVSYLAPVDVRRLRVATTLLRIGTARMGMRAMTL